MNQTSAELFNQKDVDLFECPTPSVSYEGQTIVVGDIHGSAMKLLWVLCYFGIIQLEDPETDWEMLWSYYNDFTPALSKQLIKDFEHILDSALIRENMPRKIIFLGDILADRGQNDYFTLLVFNKIHGALDYKILLSNHDLISLIYFEGEEYLGLIPDIDASCKLSFENIKLLFKKDREFKTACHHLLQTVYHPHLVLFESELTKNNTHLIYSHAVFNIGLLGEFLKTFEIPKPDNIENLKKVFFFLNSHLSSLLKEHALHTYAEFISNLVWERELSKETSDFLDSHQLINVHGHNTHPILENNRICLDSMLGRPEGRKRGSDSFPGLFVYALNGFARPVLEDRTNLSKEQKLAQRRESFFSEQANDEQENELHLRKKKP